MSVTEAIYCVDMGTTSCRVWLVEGEHIWARASGEFGVRNVSRGESRDRLRAQLEELIVRTGREAQQSGLHALPRYAVGAGMLTSAQGLLELPHLEAPAGAEDLARGLRRYPQTLADATELLLVPGVRTGSLAAGVEAALEADVMRGEEALLVGLHALGRLPANGALLNLGSHWKWIWADGQGRVARSRTALTGELIHVTETSTLLASSVAQNRPDTLDPHWLDLGSQQAESAGLSRALFCTRLLDQAGQGTPANRLAFLYGAFLETEVLALRRERLLDPSVSIALVGSPALALAWQRRLQREGLSSQLITEAERDQGYVHGLQRVVEAARRAGTVSTLSPG